MDGALALTQSFFVNFCENAYDGFQTAATVVKFQCQTVVRAVLLQASMDRMQLEPLLKKRDAGR